MAKDKPILKVAGDGSEKALAMMISALEKQHGKGVILKGSDRPDMKIEVIPTGSMGLDRALGVGGYPKGRIVEIYGRRS